MVRLVNVLGIPVFYCPVTEAVMLSRGSGMEFRALQSVMNMLKLLSAPACVYSKLR